MGRNQVIGNKNKLPWILPADMKHFMDMTMGHPVIMGRRTYQSIGEALQGRTNIVLSKRKDTFTPGCFVVNKPEDALELARASLEQGISDREDAPIHEIFVIGGGEVFRLFFPQADRIYATMIDHDFEGDVVFPEINQMQWKEVERTTGVRDGENPYIYHFVIFDRMR